MVLTEEDEKRITEIAEEVWFKMEKWREEKASEMYNKIMSLPKSKQDAWLAERKKRW